MKNPWLKLLLAAAFGLGAGGFALLSSSSDLALLCLAQPSRFVIRQLSLLAMTGEGGHTASLVLYVLICLIPSAALLIISRRRRPYAEDWLLVLMSVVELLFMHRALERTHYFNILAVQLAALSLLLAWLVLRLLRYFGGADGAGLIRLVRAASSLLGIGTAVAAGWQLASVLSIFASYRIAALLAEGAAVVLQEALVIYGCLRVFRLAGMLDPDGKFTAEAVAEAGWLYRYSAGALAAVTLSGLAANLVRLWFLESLANVSLNISLPILPLLFCLAALIVSRFIAANKRLRDDNDLFV